MSCRGPLDAVVPLLTAVPALHRLFVRLARTHAADWIAGYLARVTVKAFYAGPIDYRQVAGRHLSPSVRPGETLSQDMDSQFIAQTLDLPEGRNRVAKILRNLEQIDPEVRVGLLKTWIHTSLVTSASRDAHFLRGQPPLTGNRVATPVSPGATAGNRMSRCPASAGEGGRAAGGVPAGRSGRDPLWNRRPMDAIVAPFGGCDQGCRGCYYQGDLKGETTDPRRLNVVVDQLQALDVYHVLLAGKGEPFYDDRGRKALFAVASRHPQMFFSVYSNALGISDQDLAALKARPNILPILSLDGPAAINDWRRGPGVHARVLDVMRRMRARGMFFGYISTVFRQNLEAVTDPGFIAGMAEQGCQVGYYSLFVTPPGVTNDGMMLDAATRARYFERLGQAETGVPIPLIDIDGIEAGFGCMARRGATVYVDAITGQVSPCIRATMVDESCNLYRAGSPRGLAEILSCDVFRAFRRSLPDSGTCVAFRPS